MDAKIVNQPVFITEANQEVRTALQAACESYRELELALENHYDRRQWSKPQSSFEVIDSKLPAVTIGELMVWIENFTCVEGAQILSQPAGKALDKARARQLYSLMTPIMTHLSEVCVVPAARNETPALARALCHPRVHTDLEDLYGKLGGLGNI
jgi:hypothetical protein